MIEVILHQKRSMLWKWGENVFYWYPLNEVDEHFVSPKATPGISVTNIILCEGNYKLFGINLIERLMKQKWSKYGKKLVLISLFTRLSFCILVTLLFIETCPKLDDIERSWGKINSPYRLILYVSVLLKVIGEMLRGAIELYT